MVAFVCKGFFNFRIQQYLIKNSLVIHSILKKLLNFPIAKEKIQAFSRSVLTLCL